MTVGHGPEHEATRAEQEAASSAIRHRGPTADRMASALVRYVGVVAGEQLPAAASPRFRWAAPRTVADVMTREVRSVPMHASFKAVARALASNHGCAVPVLDSSGQVAGVVTTADLLARVAGTVPAPRGHRVGVRAGTRRKAHAQTAAELMTAPPITTTPGASVADAARLAARCRIRSLPVLNARGGLVGMVSRDDLAQVFLRSDDEIRRDVQADVDVTLRSRHGKQKNTVTVTVEDGIVTLQGHVDTALLARTLVQHAQQVVGVIGVDDQLEFAVNDAFLPFGQ